MKRLLNWEPCRDLTTKNTSLKYPDGTIMKHCGNCKYGTLHTGLNSNSCVNKTPLCNYQNYKNGGDDE